jgi:hypothetical protein
MIAKAKELLPILDKFSKLQGPQRQEAIEDCKEVISWMMHELEEYASVSDKMRQAAWRDYPSCDIPYSKIFKIMKREEASN